MEDSRVHEKDRSRWRVANFHLRAIFILGLAALFAGCAAPRQYVYYPGPERPVPPRVAPDPAGVPSPGERPLWDGPATIREMELDPGPEERGRPVEDAAERATPQHYASMHLVDQAKLALNQGRNEDAISMYEQAVQVDVYNGEAFLGLARAWFAQGASRKSLEFAKRAEMLLQEDLSRLKEVYLLQVEIYRQQGDTSQAEAYLGRASRL